MSVMTNLISQDLCVCGLCVVFLFFFVFLFLPACVGLEGTASGSVFPTLLNTRMYSLSSVDRFLIKDLRSTCVIKMQFYLEWFLNYISRMPTHQEKKLYSEYQIKVELVLQ